MKKRPVETIMGIVVLLVAAFFLFFAYRVSDLQVVRGYELNARFLKVGGLTTGADVMINGIKVGTVIGQKLDNENYDAEVKRQAAQRQRRGDRQQRPDGQQIHQNRTGQVGRTAAKRRRNYQHERLQDFGRPGRRSHFYGDGQ